MIRKICTRKIAYVFVAFVYFFFLGSALAVNITKRGTTGAKFLSIGIGSRANAMGGAFVAIANDASTMYWNPAGLARLTEREFFVNYSNWLVDISLSYTGIVIPVGRFGTVGASLTFVKSINEMEVTTEEYPEGTGETFSAGHYAIGISYGKNLTDRFSIGGSIKYIGEYIMNCRANSFAVDIGTLFLTPYKGLRFGVSISNFGKKIQITGPDLLVQKDIDERISGNNESVNAYLSTDKFDLPLILRVGIAGEIVNNKSVRLTWAMDAAHPNDNTEYLNYGLEMSLFRNMVFLRWGMNSVFMESRENKYNLGFGLNFDLTHGTKISFDYSFQQYEHLPETRQYSIVVKF